MTGESIRRDSSEATASFYRVEYREKEVVVSEVPDWFQASCPRKSNVRSLHSVIRVWPEGPWPCPEVAPHVQIRTFVPLLSFRPRGSLSFLPVSRGLPFPAPP